MDWIQALAGGVLIGIASLLLYAVSGRIAGISGITYNALLPDTADRGWRWLFLAGLVGGGWLAVAGGAAMPVASFSNIAWSIIAGLIVGIGTHLGNGCTSGHGVCGLARLSPRSLAAVVTFMGIGVLSATLLRPWLPGIGS